MLIAHFILTVPLTHPHHHCPPHPHYRPCHPYSAVCSVTAYTSLSHDTDNQGRGDGNQHSTEIQCHHTAVTSSLWFSGKPALPPPPLFQSHCKCAMPTADRVDISEASSLRPSSRLRNDIFTCTSYSGADQCKGQQG